MLKVRQCLWVPKRFKHGKNHWVCLLSKIKKNLVNFKISFPVNGSKENLPKGQSHGEFR